VKGNELQHYFSCQKCAKTHLQATAISEKFQGLYPEPLLKRGKAEGWGVLGRGRAGSLPFALERKKKVGAYGQHATKLIINHSFT
jgi:hypothetical protein